MAISQENDLITFVNSSLASRQARGGTLTSTSLSALSWGRIHLHFLAVERRPFLSRKVLADTFTFGASGGWRNHSDSRLSTQFAAA